MPKKTFYLIDGHAQIYRAYHAPFRDLTSPTGEPTKATFVFTQVLLNLVDLRKPDYLAMIIDSGDETVFRKEIYPEYKANRAKRPDDFGPQEERILQIVRDAGIPIYAKPGFEADDLIATLAKRLGGEFDVFMVSKDKDLRQCVADGVVMYDVVADESFDAAALRAKLGYGPEQAVDVQTLVGDATDNVRGVNGVGEKTAAKLINEYGSAAAVVENADKLTPKLKENVLAFAPEMDRTRRLVTLDTDVKFDFDAADCEYAGLDTDALRNHLTELGFKGLLARLGGTSDPKPTGFTADKPAPPKYQPLAGGLFDAEAPADGGEKGDGTYALVATETDLATLAADLKKQPRFAFDTETDGLGAVGSKLVGMSFTWAEGTGRYLPVMGPAGSTLLPLDQVIKAVKPILENPNIGKIGHNIKYDQLVMRGVGIDLKGVETDTMLAAFLIDASRNTYGMDKLAADLLNYQTTPISDLIGKGKKQITMDRVDLKIVTDYAAEDTDVTLRLAGLLGPKLDEIPALRKLNDDVEVPLIDVLVEMEANGIAVDPAVLKEQSEVLGGRIEALHKQIMEAAGTDFNPDSNKQLQEVLFEKLKLKPVRKTKTGYSTDLAVLEQLSSDHPVPALILEYRSLQKLKNTYLDNLQNDILADGRIHTSFNQTGASTGRLSSSDPNLQNIPIRTDEGRRIRLAFVPGDPKTQVLLTADYSQIELRMLAHYCEEPALMKAFAEEQDIHKAVASEVFATPLNEVTREQRDRAKTINFAIIYGVTAFGLARRNEGMSQTAARELIDTYKKRFPGIFDFFEQCIADAKRQGFVETILGRRRPIPEIESRIASMRQYAERTAINSVIQGSAADLIKVAMVNLHRRMKRENSPSKLLLQVHDELVFETPEAVVEREAAVIREEMTGAMSLKVPLRVEAGWGKNWQEVK